jgi:polyketide synthase 12/myxalamid-type polyketide synthase MxaF
LPSPRSGRRLQAVAAATSASPPVDEPIAILGIGCRFAGGVDGPESFWELLKRGGDAVSARPPERWADFDVPDLPAIARGAFLPDVHGFDEAFFGISPREALEMDPQQRLVLELSYEALSDAVLLPSHLKDERAGVFMGCMWQDYAYQAAAVPDALAMHSAVGLDTSVIAARVSYRFGLRGPSLTVNTGCSSGLVAVHLACQSLRSGESSIALAGGVNLMLAPHSAVAMARFGGLSADGRCKSFDARADGYVRGEGGGVIVLKRLRDAIQDNDPIYCVVRASAVNNDGASNGITAPCPRAQTELLRDAYRRAGIEPQRVHYVEAHGTGTKLGDFVEVTALAEALGKGRRPNAPLRIGSVKTNIGHTEGAAGIAGIIKVALAMRKGALPRNLHFEASNTDLAALRLQVQTAHEPWPCPDEVPIAGVSSFGFGGTNAHVVLSGMPDSSCELLPLSGASDSELMERAERLACALGAVENADELQAVCQVAATHWARDDMRAALLTSAGCRAPHGVRHAALRANARPQRRPFLAFVFSGPHSAWAGMAQSLLVSEPAFREVVEACDGSIRDLTGFSVLDALWSPQQKAFERCEQLYPLLFTVQSALSGLLRAWGFTPDWVLGHGFGEIAAAHHAGILSLQDAANIVCHTARLASRIEGRGAMVALALSAEDAACWIAHDTGLAIAARNGPLATVVSGPGSAIAALTARARAERISCTSVDATRALHGPGFDSVSSAMHAALAGISPQPAKIPMLSTTDLGWLEGPECDSLYWTRNQRQTVRFSEAVDLSALRGDVIALEIAPHPCLAEHLRAAFDTRGSVAVLPTMARNMDGRKTLLSAVAALYEAGFDPRWEMMARTPFALARLPQEARSHLPLMSSADLDNGSDALTLPLSAHSPAALREEAARFARHLATHGHVRTEDIIHKAACTRTNDLHRLTITASSRLSLAEGLGAHALGDHFPGLVATQVTSQESREQAQTTFLFSGHGSQWIGMCRELMAKEAAFDRALVEIDAALSSHGIASVRERLRDVAAAPALRADDVQPLLFAVQVALAALWNAWGIKPDLVIGHSVGEVAAAHVAGCLDLHSAARVIAERSRAIGPAIGQGAMAVIELPKEQAEALIAPYRRDVAVAVHQSPRFSVISGEADVLTELMQKLVTDEVFCRWVDVDYASHGPQMLPLAEVLRERLSGLVCEPPRIDMISTTLGARIEGAQCNADYWADNLRKPVQFHSAISLALSEGARCFVEVSPHPLLTTSVQEIARSERSSVICVPTLRRRAAEVASMHQSLGSLYVAGQTVDWARVLPSGDLRAPLPPYSFQRTHYEKHPPRITRVSEPDELDEPSHTQTTERLIPARIATWRRKLLNSSDGDRLAVLRETLAIELARVLRTSKQRIDPHTPFAELGLDSLMGLELRNRIEVELDVSVSGTALWNRPTVDELAAYILARLSEPAPPSCQAG